MPSRFSLGVKAWRSLSFLVFLLRFCPRREGTSNGFLLKRGHSVFIGLHVLEIDRLCDDRHFFLYVPLELFIQYSYLSSSFYSSIIILLFLFL